LAEAVVQEQLAVKEPPHHLSSMHDIQLPLKALMHENSLSSWLVIVASTDQYPTQENWADVLLVNMHGLVLLWQWVTAASPHDVRLLAA